MFKDKLLDGRRILVTGGGTGLGKGMAEKFLALGADIFICGRRKAVCDATAAELGGKYGGKVKSYGVDNRDAGAVDAMVEDIFQSGPLADLVNNAAGNFISRTEDLSTRGFDAVANIVLHGTFYVTHAVGRRWIASGLPCRSPPNGPITASASTLSRRASSRPRARKRLNPGASPSERTERSNPMGRVGRMEELQNLATFLLADGCEWLTGQTIMLDGGQSNATGSNFYELRHWTDEQWQAARAAIKAQNDKDRAQRA
jgi:NAD(P)-dependent dehydrogenase (short-subunit alcohol dehydrogenase family)